MSPYIAYQLTQAGCSRPGRAPRSAVDQQADARLGELAAAVSGLGRELARPAKLVRAALRRRAGA